MSERPLDSLIAELLRQAKGIGVSYATEGNIGEICARSLAMNSQLTAAQSRVAGHIEHIKSLEAEVAELRAIKFRRFSNGDCWIYQGDGEDHLESLVCPVVMSAQQVMEFEKAQSRVAELEQLLRAIQQDAKLGDEEYHVSMRLIMEIDYRIGLNAGGQVIVPNYAADNACLKQQLAELRKFINEESEVSSHLFYEFEEQDDEGEDTQFYSGRCSQIDRVQRKFKELFGEQ